MKRHLLKMLCGITLFAFLAQPALAAERHTLDTQVPAFATRLPMVERLPPTNRLRLAIALPFHNQTGLTNLLQELYNPASTNFHHFLTPEQFAGQFGPTEQDYQRVMNYARSNRLAVVGTFGNRAVLDVAGSVADIEEMFQVHLGRYQHPTENRKFFAPDVEPTVEEGFPILYVSGLDNYLIPRPSGFRSAPLPNVDNGSATNGTYLGFDFRHAYVPGTMLTGAGEVLGLVEFDEGYYPNDIANYEAKAGLPNVPMQNVTPDGPITLGTNSDTTECSLDIEMAISMAPGLAQLTVYEGNNASDVLNAIVNTNNGQPLPNQIGCSYGLSGAGLEPVFLEMAAQGQSFFYAAGDYGAYPTASNAGNIIQNYMTTVGGTELSMKGAGVAYDHETVWNGAASPSTNGMLAKDQSAGGILINVPIPFYQQNVNMSLNTGSTQWRNIPDVAMCADQIYIMDDNGGFGTAAGTSAAAPLWAGFNALVNQQAAAQGKPPVGFVNPALYEIARGALSASCFNDITNGNNTNAYSSNLYFAAKGYDLCTGLGTPKGTNLINALVGLSGPVFVNFNYTGSIQDGNYNTPFKTLAGAINKASNFGTIFIETAGSSSETMSIHKPMNITAMDGPATIGN